MDFQSENALTTLLDRLGADLHQRPPVGSSACLLGQPVRYDGDHKRNTLVTTELGRWVELRPCCPEVGIGMPVPRPPIRVVEQAGQLRAVGVTAPDQDVTEALQHYAHGISDHLCGFVLKARSPSCGLGSTPVFHDQEIIRLDDGIFAASLRRTFPGLPLIDEESLTDTVQLTRFICRVYLLQHYRRHRDLPALRQLCTRLPTPWSVNMNTFLDSLEPWQDHSR